MKNSKFLISVIAAANMFLAGSLIAQNQFSVTYKDIDNAIKGKSYNGIISPKQLVSSIIKAAKIDDDYEKLNYIYKQTLNHPQKDIIISTAIKELYDKEDYDSFLYLYDLAQKNGEVEVTSKVKADTLGNLILNADHFQKNDFFELLDGILKYIDAEEIRDNFDASYLLVETLSHGANYQDILEAMRRIIIKAGTPDNLTVNYDPKTKQQAASPDKRISLLGYWALKYKEIHSNSEANEMFATVLVINGANINEEINGEYIWQIVAQSKPSKDIKELFGL